MVQSAHLVGVRIDLGRLVVDDGVVGPGVPVAHDHLPELVRAVVTQVVLQVVFVAEVGGGEAAFAAVQAAAIQAGACAVEGEQWKVGSERPFAGAALCPPPS